MAYPPSPLDFPLHAHFGVLAQCRRRVFRQAHNAPFVTSQRNAAQPIAATIAETKEWMLKNPAEAQQTVAKVLNLPVAVVQLAWPKHDWQQKLDEFVIADIQDKADFLASENLVRRRVDVKTDLVAPLN